MRRYGVALCAVLTLGGVAAARETVTEWRYRDVPTSQPLIRCENGRTPHLKCEREVREGYKWYNWFVGNRNGRVCNLRVWCPGPQWRQSALVGLP